MRSPRERQARPLTRRGTLPPIMTPMLCQRCGKLPATIHMTEISDDGDRTEWHICEECANAEGLAQGAPVTPVALASLIQMESEVSRDADASTPAECPHCGITFEEFRTKGRFGCPHDYSVFADALNPLLDKIHGAHQHTGRLPRGQQAVDGDASDRMLRLRRELQDAVRREDYENAAKLRDTIQSLEEPDAAPAKPRATGSDES